MNILVTGGMGFIGSHVIRRLLFQYPNYHIINLDVLTYAGNPENLKDLEHNDNYTFVHGDIADPKLVKNIFNEYKIDKVIHLAAESHVDRSIEDPLVFVKTNVVGTCNLLVNAVDYWKGKKDKLFYHVSTDEVYGSLKMDNSLFTENTAYDPRSPYSSSKASSDHFVRAFYHTFGLPVVISNCSNNYGPFQFPEKLIPLFISNILNNKTLPVYGKGENVRDWLYVEDHAEAIDLILHKGSVGETYNIGGCNEWTNIDLVHLLCDTVDAATNRSTSSKELITYVTDRAGHDLRYAIDASKIKRDLGWAPKHDFSKGLKETVQWYLSNTQWLDNIKTGKYQA